MKINTRVYIDETIELDIYENIKLEDGEGNVIKEVYIDTVDYDFSGYVIVTVTENDIEISEIAPLLFNKNHWSIDDESKLEWLIENFDKISLEQLKTLI